MSKQYLAIKMDDGSEILIQSADVPRDGTSPNSEWGVDATFGCSPLRREVEFDELLDKAISQVSKFAQGAKNALLKTAAPDEIELEFNVSFSAEVKPILASSELSTGLTVHLKWTNEEQNAKAE